MESRIFPDELADSIRKTIIYFSLFDFPLTPQEVWRNLWSPQAYALRDVVGALDDMRQRGIISLRSGMYSMPGKELSSEVRRMRYSITEFKMRRCLAAVRILAHVPFVKMIAVVNSLSWSNARDESDIDLCVVAASGRVALVRLLCTGLMHILGFRTDRASPICLSFFLSESALDLRAISIPEAGGCPDIYLTYWIAQLTPLYDAGNTYDSFFAANDWIRQMVAHCLPRRTSHARQIFVSQIGSTVRHIGEWLIDHAGNRCERLARTYQERILPSYLREVLNKDSRVIMNDDMMKFHPNDRRESIRNAFINAL